jgi:hypothetical protein
MASMMKTLLVLVVCTFAVTGAAAQPAIGRQDIGLTITGTAAHEKGSDEFSIAARNGSLMLVLTKKPAAPSQPNSTLSDLWAQRMQASKVSLEIGDLRDELRGLADVLGETFLCVTSPPDTGSTERYHYLRCTAFSSTRQSKDGTLAIEIVIAVTVPIGSAGDAFLGKRRPENAVLFARLRPEL